MKTILATRYIDIPSDVTVTVDRRYIKVEGKRGSLERTFKHLQLEITHLGEKIRVDSWFSTKKALACVRTFCSHIKNMIKGVTFGYRYVMKSVYAHFPINITCVDGGKVCNLRNFLGEKVVRVVNMHDGVTVKPSGEKDEIFVEGNDLEKVSVSAALIHQSCLVKKKDIRKFLDGVYVSQKTTIESMD
jgi:large subunit ribosomal protein L9e